MDGDTTTKKQTESNASPHIYIYIIYYTNDFTSIS